MKTKTMKKCECFGAEVLCEDCDGEGKDEKALEKFDKKYPQWRWGR